MRLIAPTSSLHRSWLAARDEWAPGEFMHGASIRTAAEFDVETRDGFTAWVESLLLQADPSHERDADRTPSTNLWVVDDTDDGPRYLGALQLRHALTDFTKQYTGHIGYGVRPSARRQGVAAFALGEALPFARRLGLTRVMLTADEPNVGSWRTIEGCGGVRQDTIELNDEMRAAGFTTALRRYWITL